MLKIKLLIQFHVKTDFFGTEHFLIMLSPLSSPHYTTYSVILLSKIARCFIDLVFLFVNLRNKQI